MTAVLSPQFSLTQDELQIVAAHVGVQGLPATLVARSAHATIDSREAAAKRAMRELKSRELISNDGVNLDLASALQALHRPERELAMRLVTPDGTARISVVQRGPRGVSARRIGDQISVRVLGGRVESLDLARTLLAELPQARPADIEPVGAPLHEFAECLSDTHDPMVLGDRIRALGAEPSAAMLLGTALAVRQAFAEIVHHALADEDGRIYRGPAAVAVFYTKRGRLLGVPSISPSGQVWTTLKPGSDHAVVQAILRLLELPGDRHRAC